LADRDPEQGVTDRVATHKLRELFALLYRPPVAVA